MPTERGTYTHQQVADLFQVDRTMVYGMREVMACRVTDKPVRYSKSKIDALLDGEERSASPKRRSA